MCHESHIPPTPINIIHSLFKKNSAFVPESIITKEGIKFCYKVRPVLRNTYMNRQPTELHANFNESIPEKELPTFMNVYVSSEKNSYGVTLLEWRDGNVMKTKVDKGMYKALKLKPVQHNVLSRCSHESYFECFSRIMAAKLKGSSSQCTIFSFPSYPVCKYNKTNEETEEYVDALNQCYTHCNSLSKVQTFYIYQKRHRML